MLVAAALAVLRLHKQAVRSLIPLLEPRASLAVPWAMLYQAFGLKKSCGQLWGWEERTAGAVAGRLG